MPSYTLEEYLELPGSENVWIWNGILPQKGSAVLYADPKTGKSKLALSLAEAIADPSIVSYLGQSIDLHGSVLYIQLDTPRILWRKGYVSILKDGPARKNISIIDRECEDLPLGFDIRRPDCMDYIAKEVERRQPVMTVVDTVRRMHYGKENDSDVMTMVHDCFIRCTAPSALLYIVHKRKQQAGEEGDGSVRGSTAFTGAVDALVNMTKTKLIIEARSDVAEEIPVYQLADGTWALNSKAEEVQAFIESVQDHTPGEIDKMVMEIYGVTDRTARRWRKGHSRPS